MKTFSEIYNSDNTIGINGNKSDKGTTHSYIDYYNNIFEKKQETTRHMLEIGVWCGSAVPLWHEYFYNSQIIGVDINQEIHHKYCTVEKVVEFCKQFERMKYFPYTDAYLLNTVNSLLKETNNEGFDIIIDDGSHSPVNQAFVIVEYGKILKSGGILIIEDVSDISIFNYLSEMPISYPANFKSVDFRNVKGRQDDLLLVVEKL